MIEITLIGLVSKNEVYFYVIYDIFQLYVRSLKDHFVKKSTPSLVSDTLKYPKVSDIKI